MDTSEIYRTYPELKNLTYQDKVELSEIISACQLARSVSFVRFDDYAWDPMHGWHPVH